MNAIHDFCFPRRAALLLLATLSLTACGGGGGGGPNPPGANSPPVAVITPPEGDLLELSTITLSAAASTDPDGDDLAFTWKQLSGPDIKVINSDNAQLSFQAPKVVAQETVKLEVTARDDGGLESIASVDVVVNEGEGLVFTTSSDDDGSLWRLHPADSAPVLLHEGPGEAEVVADFKVSPDRRWVAFRDVQSRLFVVPTSGFTPAMPLLAGMANPLARAFSFEWMADSSHLVFAADDRFEDVLELLAVPVPVSDFAANRIRVSGEPLDNDGPGGAPDGIPDGGVASFTLPPAGDWIAFTGDFQEDDDEGLGLYLTRTGESPRRLTRRETRVYPWSHDGAFLAFVDLNSDDDTAKSLHAFSTADGTVQEVFGTDMQFFPEDTIVWSPNDHRVAFAARRHEAIDDSVEVFVVDAAAEEPPLLLTPVSGTNTSGVDSSVNAVRWSQDALHLAFTGTFENAGVKELFVVPVDGTAAGGERVKLSGDAAANGDVEDQANRNSGVPFLWSPAGDAIVYTGTLEANNDYRIYLTLLAQPGVRQTLLDLKQGNQFTFSDERAGWSPDGNHFATKGLMENGEPLTESERVLRVFPVREPDPVASVKIVSGTGTDHDGNGFSDGKINDFTWHAEKNELRFVGDFSTEPSVRHSLWQVKTIEDNAAVRLDLPPTLQVNEFAWFGTFGVLNPD